MFADRYHAAAVSSIAQTRHALCYVLNNWRKHRRDTSTAGLFDGRLDPYSSAVHFAGFAERTRAPQVPPSYEPPPVAEAQTWLLRQGYLRARPISVYEVPGASLAPVSARARRGSKAR